MFLYAEYIRVAVAVEEVSECNVAVFGVAFAFGAFAFGAFAFVAITTSIDVSTCRCSLSLGFGTIILVDSLQRRRQTRYVPTND